MRMLCRPTASFPRIIFNFRWLHESPANVLISDFGNGRQFPEIDKFRQRLYNGGQLFWANKTKAQFHGGAVDANCGKPKLMFDIGHAVSNFSLSRSEMSDTIFM